MVLNVLLKVAIISVNAHQVSQDNDAKTKTRACLIHATTEVNAFLKLMDLFANVHKDFQDNDAKIKCRPIHANQIHVKTEAFV